MRQIHFTFGHAKRRLEHARIRFKAATLTSSISLQLRVLHRVQYASEDAALVLHRTRHIVTTSFNVGLYSDQQCLTDFRFRREEVPIIAKICGWTDGVTARNRYRCDPITAVCLMLRRLASPARWSDLETTFGMHASAMSEVFWEVIESLVAKKGHLVANFRADLFSERAELYAKSIHAQGSPLDNCVGFIDGTKIQMARPGGHSSRQRSVYSGHKRFHCLTYQTITTPDGLIMQLFGPVEGRRHDTTLYRKSGIDAKLQQHLLIDNKRYCIYGDPAYVLRPWLQVAFPRLNATAEQKLYNTAMSAVRTAVEWSYREVKESWTTQDFKRKLQVRKSPIALLYISSVLLRNFKTCLKHGGQVVNYFEVDPPTLDSYLHFEQEKEVKSLSEEVKFRIKNKSADCAQQKNSLRVPRV